MLTSVGHCARRLVPRVFVKNTNKLTDYRVLFVFLYPSTLLKRKGSKTLARWLLCFWGFHGETNLYLDLDTCATVLGFGHVRSCMADEVATGE